MSSTQNILELNRERYLQESEDRLLQLSDAYFYKKKFLLGDGVDRDELRFTMQSHRLLNTEDCEMINFISSKIAGELEKEGHKIVDYDFESIMEQHTKTFNLTEQETIQECCAWTEIEW